jgi:fumarylpyruvate hydrolase
MMNIQKQTAAYAVDPAPVTVLPVEGSELVFPVRRVYCVGRNFAAHAIEMGSDPDREPPFYGYGVGLDMTRRDLQGKAKDTGRPWEVGKAFEASAPCTAIVPAAKIGHPTSGAVTLDINGERRQTGDLNQMIWKVPEMISYLSGLFTLAAGDIIFAGTPSGVGPVKRGDKLVGRVEGVGTLELRVV